MSNKLCSKRNISCAKPIFTFCLWRAKGRSNERIDAFGMYVMCTQNVALITEWNLSLRGFLPHLINRWAAALCVSGPRSFRGCRLFLNGFLKEVKRFLKVAYGIFMKIMIFCNKCASFAGMCVYWQKLLSHCLCVPERQGRDEKNTDPAFIYCVVAHGAANLFSKLAHWPSSLRTGSRFCCSGATILGSYFAGV